MLNVLKIKLMDGNIINIEEKIITTILDSTGAMLYVYKVIDEQTNAKLLKYMIPVHNISYLKNETYEEENENE